MSFFVCLRSTVNYKLHKNARCSEKNTPVSKNVIFLAFLSGFVLCKGKIERFLKHFFLGKCEARFDKCHLK